MSLYCTKNNIVCTYVYVCSLYVHVVLINNTIKLIHRTSALFLKKPPFSINQIMENPVNLKKNSLLDKDTFRYQNC